MSAAAPWTMIAEDRWVRSDNALVLYDHDATGATSHPWLDRPRGWKAFGPGPSKYNVLHYLRWRRFRAFIRVARKWRSAQAAMAAVDSRYPPGGPLGAEPQVAAETDEIFTTPSPIGESRGKVPYNSHQYTSRISTTNPT